MVKKILHGDDPRVVEDTIKKIREGSILRMTYDTTYVPRESVKSILTITFLETVED